MNSFINDNIVDLDDSSLYTEKAKEESKGFFGKVWEFLKTVWAKIVKLFDFIIKKLFKHDVKIKELEAKVKKLEQAKEENFEKAQFSDKDVADAKASFKEEMRLAGVKEDINLDALVDKVQSSKLDANGKEEGKKRKTVFLGGIISILKKLPKAMIHSVISQLIKNGSIDDLKVKGHVVKIDPKIKSVLASINKNNSKIKKESVDLKLFTEDKKRPTHVDDRGGYNYYDASVDLCITLVSGVSAVFASVALMPLWPVVFGIAGLISLRIITGSGKKLNLDLLYTYSAIYYQTLYLTVNYLIDSLEEYFKLEEDVVPTVPAKPAAIKVDLLPPGGPKQVGHRGEGTISRKNQKRANEIISNFKEIISTYNKCKYINKEIYQFFNYVDSDNVYREFTNYSKLISTKKINDITFTYDPEEMKKKAEDFFQKLKGIKTNANGGDKNNKVEKFDEKDFRVFHEASHIIMILISRLASASSKEEFKKNNSLELLTQGLFSNINDKNKDQNRKNEEERYQKLKNEFK